MKFKSFKLQRIIAFIILLSAIALALHGSPAPAQAASGWHTSGRDLVDPNGNVFHISGVNWFGAETPDCAPDGLWSIHYTDMLDKMKSLGYNTIRLPYSTDFMDYKGTNTGCTPNMSTYANPDLAGLAGIPLLDKIINYAGSIGMHIFLDRHRAENSTQSALWYDPGSSKYTEARWIADWQWLAQHYAGNNTIIGADLHNEPHSINGNPSISACWGCGDTTRDWKLAAERAGNAILSVNPNWLIIVEGDDTNPVTGAGTWWGGDLSNTGNDPVVLSIPNHVVYSPHDYPASIFPQTWFSDPTYPNNMPAFWDSHWGYLAKNNIAPVLIGEFGSRLGTTSDIQWFNAIQSYIKANNLSWTFWSWNPNSGDTGGILQDDWVTVIQAKQSVLAGIQYPFYGGSGAPVPTNTPGSGPTATKPPATNTPIPTATFVPPTATKMNTAIPTATQTGPTATKSPATNTPVPTNTTTAPTATKTNTPVSGPTNTPNASDPCSSPTVITGGGTFSITTAGTCFKYVNTSFVNGGMFSVMKDGSSTSDTLKWYGGTDQNVTSCSNQSATISGNGGQLNNFVVEKDANGQMFLTITASASNSVTLSIQNWQNGSGCSVKPTVHP